MASAFVDRPGGGSTTPTTIVSGPDGPELSASPGRVDPANTAWNASRKPLAGEFTFRGETYFLITNHFNSKGGDQALFGRFQPPTRATEVQRHQQAQIVNNFVDSILAVDSSANVIVLGDINDFEFSQTMSLARGRRPARADEHAAAERALQLRLRGQQPEPRPHRRQQQLVREPVRVRRGARERRVPRSALGPRSAGRPVPRQCRAHCGRGRPVHGRRGWNRAAHGHRQ